MSEYKTYLFDCVCYSQGILFKNNVACCRWCRKPLVQGAMINYEDEHFPPEVSPSGKKDLESRVTKAC